MKIYVGDVVKDAVYSDKQPIPLTRIAKALNISRTNIYTLLNKPEMEVKYIFGIGKIIGVDFSKSLKGLKDLKEEEIDLIESPESDIETQLKDELLTIHRKYILALEEIVRLKKELRELEKHSQAKS